MTRTTPEPTTTLARQISARALFLPPYKWGKIYLGRLFTFTAKFLLVAWYSATRLVWYDSRRLSRLWANALGPFTNLWDNLLLVEFYIEPS